MTMYLFSDIFKQFRKFFKVESARELKFLYDCAFGFMPRKFEDNSDDRVIYDEEEDVLEMYFFTEGVIGVGYTLVTRPITGNQNNKNNSLSIPKKLYAGPNN